jgi:hypothetical protein
VYDEAVQPSVEPIWIAEGRKVPPRAKQRLLAGILGAMLVAQDPVGEGVAAIDVARGQRRERVAIAYCCPNYEILLLHPSRPSGGGHLAASLSMEPAIGGTFKAVAMSWRPGFSRRFRRRAEAVPHQEVCRHG